VTLSPEVEALAVAKAAQDRDTLARLVRAGAVQRTGAYSAFAQDIEERAFPQKRAINLAIRPKRKRR
jgi:hypothetical protein